MSSSKHDSELDTVITLNQASETQTPIRHLHKAQQDSRTHVLKT